MQSRSPPVSPSLALTAGCFQPSHPCRRQSTGVRHASQEGWAGALAKKTTAQHKEGWYTEHQLPPSHHAACTYGSCCGSADKPGPEGPRGSQLQSPPPEGASCALGSKGKPSNEGVQGGAGTTSPLPIPYSFSALLPSPTCWPKNHLPSRRSEAEPRQYSITSYRRVKGQRSADVATPGLAHSGRDPKQRASLPSHYSSNAPQGNNREKGQPRKQKGGGSPWS